MSEFTSQDATRRQLEFLRPHEIRSALASCPVVYLPLGTIEWHCEHLPVGLDALTAHGVCLRAAAAYGGLVYPPLHYGTGGDHGGYPWTVMMSGGGEIRAQLNHTLSRLQDFGVRVAVLFTGHFADEQLEMVRQLADTWNQAGHPMRVVAAAVNMVKDAPIAPDHAGVFETTLLYALWPERVDLLRLPPKPLKDAPDDSWSSARHEHGHPLWGIVGPDPRDFDPNVAEPLLGAVVNWLVAQSREAVESDSVCSTARADSVPDASI
jgi:creatinine amidohydrolase